MYGKTADKILRFRRKNRRSNTLGDYSEEQENLRLCEEHKEDCGLRIIEAKFYALFNRFSIARIINYEGLES